MVTKHDLKLEDQLLLLCSITKPSTEDEKLIKHILKYNLDWDYLINSAYQNRLSSLLYWQLNRINSNVIPKRVENDLKKHFHFNVRKNLSMFKELLNIVDLLQKNGITPIPYKGPVLAIMTYGNLGFREFGDLDFYVPLNDVSQTRDILIRNGFEPLLKLTSNQENTFYKFQREYKFKNEETGINIEIKWKFLSTLVSINKESFFYHNEFLKEVDIDQFKVKTISPQYLILILSIHNASHSFSSLYRFCDISELIKSDDNINWQHLLEIASDLGVQRIFMINLYILSDLFRINLPKEVLEQIKKDINIRYISEGIIRRLFTFKPLKILEKVDLHMRLHEKKIDKLKILVRMVFSPTPQVIESVSLPLFLEPVYYILQFLHILKHTITNVTNK